MFFVHPQNGLNSLILNWCIGGCWFTPTLIRLMLVPGLAVSQQIFDGLHLHGGGGNGPSSCLCFWHHLLLLLLLLCCCRLLITIFCLQSTGIFINIQTSRQHMTSHTLPPWVFSPQPTPKDQLIKE